MRPIAIMSFGAGVRSTAIVRMSLEGELPPLDHLIFADTGAEWPETYETAEEIRRACHNRGIGFHRVFSHYKHSSGNLFDDLEGDGPRRRWSAPPLFIDNSDIGKSPSMTQRQCTGHYKIEPIARKVRELAGIKPGARGPKEVVVERWLGISSDEFQRMKLPQFRWEAVWHPLIEGPRRMTRGDCEQWLRRHGYSLPVKSACVFCPYQSDRRWLELADKRPDVFARCGRLDEHLRASPSGFDKGEPYLHRSLRPLTEVVVSLRAALDRSPELDLDLFADECSGVCGV